MEELTLSQAIESFVLAVIFTTILITLYLIWFHAGQADKRHKDESDRKKLFYKIDELSGQLSEKEKTIAIQDNIIRDLKDLSQYDDDKNDHESYNVFV